MVVLLTYGLCPRKKPVSHLTSAARLACSSILGVGILFRLFNLYGYVRVPVRAIVPFVCVRLFMCHAR
jgi:hypothetical protein